MLRKIRFPASNIINYESKIKNQILIFLDAAVTASCLCWQLQQKITQKTTHHIVFVAAWEKFNMKDLFCY